MEIIIIPSQQFPILYRYSYILTYLFIITTSIISRCRLFLMTNYVDLNDLEHLPLSTSPAGHLGIAFTQQRRYASMRAGSEIITYIESKSRSWLREISTLTQPRSESIDRA